jgi:hypothetical protein
MANYTFSSLTTAVDGFNDTLSFSVQVNTSSYIISTTNGTVSVGNLSGLNISITGDTKPGFLTGRRPVSGQVFPRGVYNK